MVEVPDPLEYRLEYIFVIHIAKCHLAVAVKPLEYLNTCILEIIIDPWACLALVRDHICLVAYFTVYVIRAGSRYLEEEMLSLHIHFEIRIRYSS